MITLKEVMESVGDVLGVSKNPKYGIDYDPVSGGDEGLGSVNVVQIGTAFYDGENFLHDLDARIQNNT